MRRPLPITSCSNVTKHRKRSLRSRRGAARAKLLGEIGRHLREPATLYFVHECSHQDIVTFLGLSLPTVNNRLHAARKQLKQRMMTMMKDTLHSHGLPDDFANRIGRLVEARGGIVEALFDPAAMPDILAELAVSDEANRRAVNVHVVQRMGNGLVRGVVHSQQC